MSREGCRVPSGGLTLIIVPINVDIKRPLSSPMVVSVITAVFTTALAMTIIHYYH